MIGSPNHRFSEQMSPLNSHLVDSSRLLISNKKLENMNCIFRPSDILGGLYLGDIISTLKEDHLKNNNIGAILTCMCEAIKINPSISCHKILAIKDLLQYPIIPHFDDAVAWICQKRKEKYNVLVHCHAGISRSATIVIAYLIRTQNWNPFQAFEFVRQQRERIKPNASFWNQLNQYYHYWSKQTISVQPQTKINKQVACQPASIIHKVVSQQSLPSRSTIFHDSQPEESKQAKKTQDLKRQNETQKVSVRRRRKIFEKLTFQHSSGNESKNEAVQSTQCLPSLHGLHSHFYPSNSSLIQQNSSMISNRILIIAPGGRQKSPVWNKK